MNPVVTSRMRQAALELHELHAEDRSEVLGELDPASQAVLRELLDELQALRIPPIGHRAFKAFAPAACESLLDAWRITSR